MSLTALGTQDYDSIETVHEKREEVLGGSVVHFGVAASKFAPLRTVGVVGTDFKEADPDMQAFFEHLRSDPKYFFNSEEEILTAYDELRNTIDPTLDKSFDVKAKAPYVIKAVEPFRAQSMAAAQYFPGTPDGSRPGIFYVNTYDLSSRPNYVMEALSLHEASPGHHFQISISQEVEERFHKGHQQEPLLVFSLDLV